MATNDDELRVRSAAPTDVPITLTHYTELAGLKGIVKNKEFWLSNASFLNDPEELRHGVRRAQAVIKNMSASVVVEDPTSRGRRDLINRIAKDFTAFAVPDAYVTCFCEDGDLLSQWRGYSARQGISVTFKIDGLRSAFNDMGAEIQQVHYGTQRASKEMMAHIKRELPDIMDDFEYMMGSMTTDQIRQAFSELMARLVPRFKHQGFAEEKEWRFVVIDPPNSALQFRPRGQLMLPYVHLRSKSGDRLPITKVTIGPGIHDDAVATSMKFFMSKMGYSTDVVAASSTPYRS